MEISAIIPVYNRSTVCLTAIQSALNQTHTAFELIVVDDGSEEDMEVVQKTVTVGGGKYFSCAHRGVAAARNYGVSRASGEWLAFLDSDDCWLPQKTQLQIEFHCQNPNVLISQTEEIWFRHGQRVNPKQRHAKPNGDAFHKSLELCCISPSAVMIKRELFEGSGGFDEKMPVCEDYDLWLRLAVANKVGLVDLPLVEKYGGHHDQLSRSEPAMDRFRVYSLAKLLQSGLLNPQQRVLAASTLKKKANVLRAGAIKRGNLDAVEQLSKLIEIAENISVISDLVDKTAHVWFQFPEREFLLSWQTDRL